MAMQTNRLRCLPSLLAAAALLLVFPSLAVAQDVAIRGRVRNAEGKIIRFASVTVRDAEGTKVSAVPKYDDDGDTFVVQVPAKLGKVSVLFEDRPFHHPHLVTNLSTTPGDDHTINPVLRKSSGPAGYDLILEQILIYEQLLFSEVGAKPSRDTVLGFKARHERMISQMPDPARMETYAEDSVQHKALSKMTREQRTLVGFKLRQFESNINALLRSTTTGDDAAPAPTVPPVN
jgi:hypothetical protein